MMLDQVLNLYFPEVKMSEVVERDELDEVVDKPRTTIGT